MSKLDINNINDFNRLTMGSVASVVQEAALFGRSPDQWDIEEASYKGVKFHVFKSKENFDAGLSQMSDRGGRRKVKYLYPYRDGQTTDDLGRKPKTFECDAVFFGTNYLNALQDFIAAIDNETPGILIHPVMGEFTVAAEDYEILHKAEERKAAHIRVTFIEHDFSVGDLSFSTKTGSKDAIAKLLDAFALIDKAVTDITGKVVFVQSLKNGLTQSLTDYKNKFGTTSTRMNTTFNGGDAASFPSLLPVNQGGNRRSDGTLVTELFQTSISPNDKLATLPSGVLSEEAQQALAVTQLTKEVQDIRFDLKDIVNRINTGANGLGSLEFYDNVLDLKLTGILMQDALEKGIASSKAQVIDYILQTVMSLREVAFANGLEVNRVTEIDLLNPALESTNYLIAGTVVKVPIA